MVNILSGKDVSRKVYTDLTPRINSLKEKGITPCLAVILVGEDSASKIYVNSKTKNLNRWACIPKPFTLKTPLMKQY